MAVQATAQWWIRTDGDDDNGGGFDSGISGAGTNYSDQATAQLDLTDLATASAGSTTLTSATGGFTSAMVGNSIKIRSGTNLVAGHYFITGFASSNSVTLDRSPDNGNGGISVASGKVGGAWTNIERTLSTEAVALGNTVASPLVAGNQVNVRGSGSENPSTPDYQFTSYRSLPSGTVEERIKFVGYNGKPSIQAASSSGSLIFLTIRNYVVRDMKFVANGTGFSVYGLVRSFDSFLHRCIFDMAGYNAKAGQGSAYECLFYDSGSASQITNTIWQTENYNAIIAYNFFDGLASTVAALSDSSMATVQGNVFSLPSNAKGIYISQQNGFKTNVSGNTFFGGSVAIDNRRHTGGIISNNIFSGCTTGIKWSGVSGDGKPPAEMIIGNAFHNCTANYDNISGTDDILLTADPFVDSANSDFKLNSNAGGGATLRANNLSLNTDTSVYPFRQYVSDDFDSGAGGGATVHPLYAN